MFSMQAEMHDAAAVPLVLDFGAYPTVGGLSIRRVNSDKAAGTPH